MPKMKTIQQLADESGLSYNAIRKLCMENRIVHIKVGSKYMINVEKFRKFLNGENAAVDTEEDENSI